MQYPYRVLIMSLLFLVFGCKKYNEDAFEGKIFTGYEPIRMILDPENPNYRWFCKTKMTFAKDSVLIEKSAVAVDKSDTLHSASDGGFYKYKGTWKANPRFEINAVETSCDYCPETMQKTADGRYKKIVRTLNYLGAAKNRELFLNGIAFKM